MKKSYCQSTWVMDVRTRNPPPRWGGSGRRRGLVVFSAKEGRCVNVPSKFFSDLDNLSFCLIIWLAWWVLLEVDVYCFTYVRQRRFQGTLPHFCHKFLHGQDVRVYSVTRAILQGMKLNKRNLFHRKWLHGLFNSSGYLRKQCESEQSLCVWNSERSVLSRRSDF